jgi:hypothetical protein
MFGDEPFDSIAISAYGDYYALLMSEAEDFLVMIDLMHEVIDDLDIDDFEVDYYEFYDVIPAYSCREFIVYDLFQQHFN